MYAHISVVLVMVCRYTQKRRRGRAEKGKDCARKRGKNPNGRKFEEDIRSSLSIHRILSSYVIVYKKKEK